MASEHSTLIHCECCGGSISDAAIACPLCGDPMEAAKSKQNHGIVAIYQLLGILSILAGLFVPIAARFMLSAAMLWFGWLAAAALGCFALAAIIQALRQIEYNTRVR